MRNCITRTIRTTIYKVILANPQGKQFTEDTIEVMAGSKLSKEYTAPEGMIVLGYEPVGERYAIYSMPITEFIANATIVSGGEVEEEGSAE